MFKEKMYFLLKFLFDKTFYQGVFVSRNVFYLQNRSVHNLGDYFGEIIYEYYCSGKILDKPSFPINFLLRDYVKNYLVIGSILKYARSKSIVLGCGLNDIEDLAVISKESKIIFVRGSLTQKALLNIGLRTEFIADPGLLISKLFPFNRCSNTVFRKCIILNHHENMESPLLKEFQKNGFVLFNMNYSNGVGAFVDFLNNFDLIISTSLHGLVFADSYGINCIPCYTTNSIVSKFKFYDYISPFPNRSSYILRKIDDFVSMNDNELLDCAINPIENLSEIIDRLDIAMRLNIKP
jgi:pyruvyltransferase